MHKKSVLKCIIQWTHRVCNLQTPEINGTKITKTENEPEPPYWSITNTQVRKTGATANSKQILSTSFIRINIKMNSYCLSFFLLLISEH